LAGVKTKSDLVLLLISFSGVFIILWTFKRFSKRLKTETGVMSIIGSFTTASFILTFLYPPGTSEYKFNEETIARMIISVIAVFSLDI
jgi:hypothetical protein